MPEFDSCRNPSFLREGRALNFSYLRSGIWFATPSVVRFGVWTREHTFSSTRGSSETNSTSADRFWFIVAPGRPPHERSLQCAEHGAEEIAVVQTMKSHTFDVMGSMRSYWDFLFGYGLFLTIGLLVQAVLFWELATLVKTNPGWTKPILALFFFNCIGMAIVSWKYFFIGPAVAQLLIAACLALAFATARAAV
jgi:hypothetical protein